MVTAVHILSLECDFDISLDELIYPLDKTASRMATVLLIVATSITRADCTFFSVNCLFLFQAPQVLSSLDQPFWSCSTFVAAEWVTSIKKKKKV